MISRLTITPTPLPPRPQPTKTHPSSFLILATLIIPFLLASCAGDRRHQILISTHDQKMLLLRDGTPIRSYPVSTSKFGVGDEPGSCATPIGKLRVKKKIGDGIPLGGVFKSREFTGEILPINAPGRDPIVTRILWLEGLEPQNRQAYHRYIYIHGTPEEHSIGTPASYGCIRMRSRDVIELYNTVGTGTRVHILTQPLPTKF